MFLRVEILFIAALAFLILWFSYFQLQQQWLVAVLVTLMFIGLYAVIAVIIKSLHRVKHNYLLSNKHLQITQTRGAKTVTEKIPWKHIFRQKLDRFLLGGYIVTKKGRKYVLFFNNNKELEKYKKHLNHHGLYSVGQK